MGCEVSDFSSLRAKHCWNGLNKSHRVGPFCRVALGVFDVFWTPRFGFSTEEELIRSLRSGHLNAVGEGEVLSA